MSKARERFWDPEGQQFGIPTYPWDMAPPGLLTMRQLAAKGLRPGGQPVAAQVLWNSNRYHAPGGIRAAYLYREDLAKPRRQATPAQMEAIGKALRARRICPRCGRDAGHDIPRKLGCCLECAQPWELDQAA